MANVSHDILVQSSLYEINNDIIVTTLQRDAPPGVEALR